ncbi:hypothetical protein Bca52824_004234 [Brassica carinata]|uniref:Uncharacterized protein n=1 Tax=Brassica carinata TaxID=52824 RepID=A0A8X8BC63_BRACI|nr:hypothetical protein Bca52824_004234 [Brassica carinata]
MGELERKCLRSTDREEGNKRCRLQERSRNAGCARRQCTLWSFSQLMVSLFTSLASSVLTANPPFKSVSFFTF